jgi:hypothetical protein
MTRLQYFQIVLSVLAPLASAGAADGPANQALSIAVLQGDGAVNSLRTGTVTPPIVEVRDEFMRPVAGAEVVFQLPDSGAGGTFAGGATETTAKTNAAGQAGAPEFQLNDKEGHYFIQVTARLAGRVGTTRIAQSNSKTMSSTGPTASRGRSKVWRVLGIAGGGAITVGLIMLSRGGGSDGGSTGSSSSSPTITLNPGTITVGGPR